MSAANKSRDVTDMKCRFKNEWSFSTLWCRSLKSTCINIQSATIVIAYLIKYKGMTFLQALKYLKSKRPQVCPNLGFQLQLKNYEALNSYSKNLSQRKSVQKSDNRPVVFKRTGFNITTYNKSYYPDIHQNRSSHQSINEKNKFVNKQKQELEYICKMAQFRFGITNMSKWRLSIRHGKPLKKVFEL